jgi:hypothetical protein
MKPYVPIGRAVPGVQLVVQLPLLVLRTPAWLAWHKQWSGWYMDAIEPAIVLIALSQFFLVDLRRQCGGSYSPASCSSPRRNCSCTPMHGCS